MKQNQLNDQAAGLVSGIAAFILWGVLPVYWKLIDSVPAREILAHRIVWSFVFMVFLLTVTGKLRHFVAETRQIIARPKKLFLVFTASSIISINWVTYIWAVNNNHIIETSLGYYINPLVTVLLGIVVLKERLSFWQAVSFFLALAGVLNMALHYGAVPRVALLLAVSFGLYGLFKKMIDLGAVTGITLETLVISPVALIYLCYIHYSGSGAFGLHAPAVSGLLAGAGVVTAVPLVLFADGTKRLPLSLVGFLQYISPTIGLILGIFLYRERFTAVELESFAFIWVALIIFSLAKTKFFVKTEVWLFKRAELKGKGTT